jgi:hypothetical protein
MVDTLSGSPVNRFEPSIRTRKSYPVATPLDLRSTVAISDQISSGDLWSGEIDLCVISLFFPDNESRQTSPTTHGLLLGETE